jgi:hypothetical protein
MQLGGGGGMWGKTLSGPLRRIEQTYGKLLYGMYTLAQNDVKAVLKASDVVNNLTAVNSSGRRLPGTKQAQAAWLLRGYLADSQEVDCTSPKICGRQAASKSGKTLHLSDTETTGAGGSQAATNSDDFYHKPNSTPKWLNRTRQRRVQVPKYTKWDSYHKKRNDGLFSHEILPGGK